MPARWTIKQASGIGASAGLVALLVWPFALAYPESLSWPLLGAALVVLALLEAEAVASQF